MGSFIPYKDKDDRLKVAQKHEPLQQVNPTVVIDTARPKIGVKMLGSATVIMQPCVPYS
jgi:hypothetical protein